MPDSSDRPTTRVAILTSSYPRTSETFVYREAEALRAAGVDVTTIVLRRPLQPARDVQIADRAIYSDGGALLGAILAEAITHPWQSLRTAARCVSDAIVAGEPTSFAFRLKTLLHGIVALAVARWLRASDVAHLHCHFAHAPASVAMYAARQTGIPWSFVGHANDIFHRRTLLAKKLARATFVSCITEWHRDFYTEIVPRAAADYPIIRCGVPLEEWAFFERNTDPGRPLIVLTVARLFAKKGIIHLVDAFAALPPAIRDHAELRILGDGPESEPIAGRIAAHGLRNAHLMGRQDNEIVRDWMQRAGVFCLPSVTDRNGDRDGLPVVLMEAMATGCPVIAGDLPAIRELVIDGHNGRLVDPEAGELLPALQALLGDARLRADLARRGRAHIEKEFSLAEARNRLLGRITGRVPAADPVATRSPCNSDVANPEWESISP